METTPVNGLTLFFDAEERDAADLIGGACRESIPLLRQCWGLEPPKACRVYVVTSWLHFILHSTPWYGWVPLGLLLPIWFFRARKMWRFVGGWTQRYKHRPAVGVKPPRLLRQTDRRVGERIFVKADDFGEKVRQITCHELVHAFSAHLRLPMWLNEGVAMVTVDRFAKAPTVKRQSLQTLSRSPRNVKPGKYWRLPRMSDEEIVYHYVRGYWITRYLEDTQPGLLRSLLARPRRKAVLESEVAAALGMTRESLWRDIDAAVAAHFGAEESLDGICVLKPIADR